MSQFFIVKTGWEIFDLSRAYGLGILLYGLTSKSEVSLRDKNYWYEISSTSVQKPDVNKVSEFLSGEYVREVLATLGRVIQKQKMDRVKAFLKDGKKVKDILNSHLRFEVPEIPSRGKIETLYQPMELRATKGLREPVRLKRKYSEGTPLKIKMKDWVLSFLGHLNITTWKYSRDFNELLVAMPVPTAEGTEIRDLYTEIKKRIDESVRRIHRAGKLPTLAWIGTKIIRTRLELMTEEWEYHPEFSSILYGSMVGAGRQRKPATAGIFPLEYLNEIAKSHKAKVILESWGEIFRKTNQAGYEDLATSLSRYLADPNSINFENYSRLHLRYLLAKKIKLPLYSKEMIKKVMGSVRS